MRPRFILRSHSISGLQIVANSSLKTMISHGKLARKCGKRVNGAPLVDFRGLFTYENATSGRPARQGQKSGRSKKTLSTRRAALRGNKINGYQAYLSTLKARAEAPARFPCAPFHQGRPQGSFCAPQPWPQAALRLTPSAVDGKRPREDKARSAEKPAGLFACAIGRTPPWTPVRAGSAGPQGAG